MAIAAMKSSNNNQCLLFGVIFSNALLKFIQFPSISHYKLFLKEKIEKNE